MRSLINKLNSSLNSFIVSTPLFFSVYLANHVPDHIDPNDAKDIKIDQKILGFKIPTFSEILTSLIQLFFVIAGLAALFMLLTGALAWVTSGGNKENVEKARDKITQALVGIILIIIVLAIIWSLEQIVFGGNLCFGISCRVTIPGLLKPPE